MPVTDELDTEPKERSSGHLDTPYRLKAEEKQFIVNRRLYMRLCYMLRGGVSRALMVRCPVCRV